MLFQTLDDKSECVGIYCDDKLVFDPDLFPEDLTATWKYCTYLKNLGNIEYANLYLQGSPLEAAIPEYLQDDWQDVSQRIQAFQRSLSLSKVDSIDIYHLSKIISSSSWPPIYISEVSLSFPSII